jgi:hypothetical protein
MRVVDPDEVYAGDTPNPLNVMVGNVGLPANAPPAMEYTSVDNADPVDPIVASVWIGARKLEDVQPLE